MIKILLASLYIALGDAGSNKVIRPGVDQSESPPAAQCSNPRPLRNS